MIINIRGTGGAGKSALVRAVMRRYPTQQPEFIVGRRQPIGYLCVAPGGRPLWVVGHYETACGGGDTLKSPAEVYEQIARATTLGAHVIFEGIISQDDVTRCAALVTAGQEVHVIGLRVPIEVCLAGIQSRRDVRGDARPLDPKNTVERAKRLDGIMTRLQAAGVTAAWMDRDAALVAVLALLGLGAEAAPAVPAPEFQLR